TPSTWSRRPTGGKSCRSPTPARPKVASCRSNAPDSELVGTDDVVQINVPARLQSAVVIRRGNRAYARYVVPLNIGVNLGVDLNPRERADVAILGIGNRIAGVLSGVVRD